MNKLLCAVCVSALALATTALGGNRHHGNGGSPGVRGHGGAPSAKSFAPAMSRHVMSAQPKQRYISRAPFRQRTYVSGNTIRHGNAVNATARSRVTLNRERSFARNRRVNVGSNSNLAVNRNRNVTRNRNATVTNNWRGDRFSGRNYAVFRDYHRQWHNRDWWRHHYSRIIFVDDGWWYWNAGYWFPAWGYDPYAYYPYDGPIYGYSNLTPYQVVVQVQTQLARDGYYAGPIDGVLGPMTRNAIAAFQADNGLAVTSTVDEPTMSTLGLT